MATIPKQRRTREIDYPTSDGRPMGETEIHIDELIDTLLVVRDWFARNPSVYVGGNMLVYYEEGNPRKHVSPDVFVALEVPKEPKREYYLVWKEGKAPDFIVEITSKTTRREDKKKKLPLYRDVLKVSEYFLFDPRCEYLDPPLQGFRPVGGDYVAIEPVAGRLPSEVLGLHLEHEGKHLRLFDPATGKWLPTRLESREAAESMAEVERRRADLEQQRAAEEHRRAEEEHQRANLADQQAGEERQRAETAEAEQRRLAEEIERLRREIEPIRDK